MVGLSAVLVVGCMLLCPVRCDAMFWWSADPAAEYRDKGTPDVGAVVVEDGFLLVGSRTNDMPVVGEPVSG